MLSILIPVYKYDFRPLISFLNESADAAGIVYEIICLDDGSGHQYDHLFAIDSQISNRIKLVRLDTNTGRSAARNKLASLSNYEHLLFLDNDVMPLNGNFISAYATCLGKYDVICGGRVYKDESPENSLLKLHWIYGSKRESKNASKRSTNPYIGFHSNNFVIKNSLYQLIKFDEQLKEYGHEDSLFGKELEKVRAKILHIDNPVEHLDLEKWDVFVDKSLKACKNAVFIFYDKQICVNKLTDYAVRLNRMQLDTPLIWILKKLKRTLLNKLASTNPNLISLDLIKMLFTLEEIKKQKKGNKN